MMKPSFFLTLLITATSAAAELTEEDIIAKELAWAKKSVSYYEKGFKEKHPLRWAVPDDALFEMPKHEPINLNENQEVMASFNLRGAKTL